MAAVVRDKRRERGALSVKMESDYRLEARAKEGRRTGRETSEESASCRLMLVSSARPISSMIPTTRALPMKKARFTSEMPDNFV